MTKEEILTMEAGEQLDKLVEEVVFSNEYLNSPYKSLPLYSTDISAAWQIVEKLEHYEFRINNEYHSGKWYWYCGIEQPEDLGEGFFSATAETLPEAICKAALLVKLEESGK